MNANQSYISHADHRYQAMERAVRAGQTLRIEPPRTELTLQGRVERGHCVWGMAHGGDSVGCLFPTREEAQAFIDELQRNA